MRLALLACLLSLPLSAAEDTTWLQSKGTLLFHDAFEREETGNRAKDIGNGWNSATADRVPQIKQADLDAGSHAVITTPGATRFYRSAGPLAEQQVQATLADGARLEWLPLETIAYPDCHALNRLEMTLAPGAECMGWDVCALGLPHAGQPFERGAKPPVSLALARPGHILGRDDRLLALKITLHAKTGEILAQFKDHRRLPALNIARQVRHFRQSRAPIGFDRQLVSRNRLARAAPDTLTAVIFLQPAPQRPGSHRLQFRLDRGADRQAAPEELFFPKGARQLTPNLIGEIAARRQRLAEGGIIAVLHRF